LARRAGRFRSAGQFLDYGVLVLPFIFKRKEGWLKKPAGLYPI
jgi:hypothetical protein